MIKSGTVLVFTFLISNITLSQSKMYLDDKFKEIEEEKATYYRISKPHPDGTSRVFVQTYYMSGQLKCTASCDDHLCIRPDGYYVSYYENGNKEEEGYRVKKSRTGVWNEWYENGQLKEMAAYSAGIKMGIWKTWYDNGQQKEEIDAVGDRNSAPQLQNKLINYWDRAGQQLVIDGSGEVVYYHEDTTTVESEGQYKNGLKFGLWKGYTEENRLMYEENYKRGKISGVSWDDDGNEYKYDQLDEQPEPAGGIPGFYKHVAKTIEYPTKARRGGIQGRVYVQFVVEKDGSLIDIEVIKGIGAGCDREAERVVRSSPKWTVGKQRGKPVKVRMILPITFKLS